MDVSIVQYEVMSQYVIREWIPVTFYSLITLTQVLRMKKNLIKNTLLSRGKSLQRYYLPIWKYQIEVDEFNILSEITNELNNSNNSIVQFSRRFEAKLTSIYMNPRITTSLNHDKRYIVQKYSVLYNYKDTFAIWNRSHKLWTRPLQ